MAILRRIYRNAYIVENDMINKETLLKSLSNEPIAVIQTAYLYAHNLHLYGADITKEWLTAVENTVNLEKAYRKGFADAYQELARNKETENGRLYAESMG